jgi:hypothetical protein
VKTLLATAALSAALASGVHAADVTVNAPLNVLNIQGEIVEGDAAKIGNLAPQLSGTAYDDDWAVSEPATSIMSCSSVTSAKVSCRLT